jgi:hypothetical protein
MTDRVISPLNCIQELIPRDRHYPWRVMVTCALLNQTHGRQVRPIIVKFWSLLPDPLSVLHVHKHIETAVRDLIRPLGFGTKRWTTIQRMTTDYVLGTLPEKCFGCGKYCRDAVALFVHGRTDVQPDDTWLRPYLEWRLSGGPRLEWDRGQTV